MPGNTESILYDTNGDPLAVDDGVAIPAGTPMILSGGSDGTNSRYIKVDSSGNQILVGLGTAGSPTGGVITIQGDSSGTPLPISITGTNTISGTVTANQGNANTAANGWPVKITDGTNILGTSGNPIRIDPTGTTTQPISGTVTANAGTGNFAVVQATAALLNATVTANGNFNNASVSATAATIPSFATFVGGSVTTVSPTYTNGNINALSLTTAGALRIDGSGVTQPVSGTVTANAGTGTFNVAGTVTANQGTPNTLANRWPVIITDGTNTMPTGDTVARSIFEQISDGITGPVAVKPSSTAPVATDKAMVVVISPNQQSIPVASTPATANGGLRAGYARLGGGTSGVLIPVFSTTYNEQSSNAQRSISSSSTNDTSAGTGARSVRITYYTATFTGPFTEDIILNGTSAVNTTNTNICYIESLVVLTVGSTGVNVGTITLYASTGGGGGAVSSIGSNTLTGATGDTRTLYAQHYVPSGKTCFITGFLVSSSGTTSFFLKSKDLATANAAEQIISGVIPTANPFERSYGSPISVVGPARILAYAIPSSNNMTISASIDFFEQ